MNTIEMISRFDRVKAFGCPVLEIDGDGVITRTANVPPWLHPHVLEILKPGFKIRADYRRDRIDRATLDKFVILKAA